MAMSLVVRESSAAFVVALAPSILLLSCSRFCCTFVTSLVEASIFCLTSSVILSTSFCLSSLAFTTSASFCFTVSVLVLSFLATASATLRVSAARVLESLAIPLTSSITSGSICKKDAAACSGMDLYRLSKVLSSSVGKALTSVLALSLYLFTLFLVCASLLSASFTTASASAFFSSTSASASVSFLVTASATSAVCVARLPDEDAS